jgi:hypothetical protein
VGPAAILRAIALVNDVADGAGDEEVTPNRIALAVGEALDAATNQGPSVIRNLRVALDAVSDGMSADYVALHLYAALADWTPASEG